MVSGGKVKSLIARPVSRPLLFSQMWIRVVTAAAVVSENKSPSRGENVIRLRRGDVSENAQITRVNCSEKIINKKKL